MRTARALGALLCLVGLLVGVPALLLALGNPALLLGTDLGSIASRPLGGRAIAGLLSVIGWLSWLAVVIATSVEILAVASRGRVRLRVPGTGWLRPLVGSLVVAAMAAPGLAHADPIQPRDDPVAAAPTTAHGVAPLTAGEKTAIYEVVAGDELWDIAERELGAGERWREIVALNADIDASLRITPGQRLRIPQPAEPTPTEDVPTVVVARGDSLWAIADRLLGDGDRWPEIYRLNRGLISDPDSIDIGWVLKIPTPPEGAGIGPPPAPAEAKAVQPPPVAPIADGRAAAAVPDDHDPPPSATALAPAGTSVPNAPDTAETVGTDAATDSVGLLAGMGALTAFGVLAGVAARRRRQLLDRQVGRRVLPMPAESSVLLGALALKAQGSESAAQERTGTSVLIGWDTDGNPLWLDLEMERATILTGPAGPAGMAGILTSLSSATWSSGVEIVHVSTPDWVEAFDDPRMTSIPDTDDAIAELTRRCAARRVEMRGSTLEQQRSDPDKAPAWRPCVFVFDDALSAAQLDAVDEALRLGVVGVSVVARSAITPAFARTPLSLGHTSATLRGAPMVPQLVSSPARRALIDLLTVSGSVETDPAPWWRLPDALPPNVLPLPRVDAGEERTMSETIDDPPHHPTLLLLGDVTLSAPAGDPPNRAPLQCMEYCAWLLQNPGATPGAMVRSLLVAETTRRSNMSRLRTWLGAAPDGRPYLPDAYSGRIRLDERVTSDWEHFEALLTGGVNVASTRALRQALRLVRGEPLGSLGFQWHWAQTLRADMVSMIVDAACVLADRAIGHDDPDSALWAVRRGRLAAPDADQLMAREIHALAIAGRRVDTERAIVALNRTTREAGRDLPPDVAQRVQQAIHLLARPVAGGAP